MLDGSYFIECACSSDEHTLRFSIDAEDKVIFTSVFLNHSRPWYKRVWIAIKYIFGYKSIYGHWDCTIIDYNGVEQMKSLILDYYDLIKERKCT